MRTIESIFKLVDNQTISGSFTSKDAQGEEGHCFANNYSFYLTITASNTANAKVTLQGSNDRVNWFDYHESSTDVELTDEGVAFRDAQMYPLFFRLNFEGNATNITALLLTKTQG